MRLLFVCLLVCLSACAVDLGECDPALATHVTYHNGVPAYEGQAMVATTCGNASFCHSSAAEGELRYGASLGLDFDVQIASTRTAMSDLERELEAASTARLRSAQDNVRAYAEHIYREVESGRMPPFGAATTDTLTGLPRYADAEGRRVPPVDSYEGLEVLRNWLACDAPVVERTTPRPEGGATVGDIVPRLEQE